MSSRVYGGPWTMWWDAKDDQANGDWHRTVTAARRPHTIGTYIGEANTVERPDSAVAAFTPEKWRRLCALRDRHDPGRVFFDDFDGLENRSVEAGT